MLRGARSNRISRPAVADARPDFKAIVDTMMTVLAEEKGHKKGVFSSAMAT